MPQGSRLPFAPRRVGAELSAADRQFILPFGPGSGTDITARLVADKLSARWGKPVVIENRPGGDGLVAINAFLAANDDHTLLWVPVGTFAVHPYEKEKLPYDAERDLLPIANVTSLFLALPSPSLGVNSLRELVELVRANPGKYNWAAANGNADFLMSGFLKSNGLQMAKTPYRDILQAPNDLAENRIQLLSSSLAAVTPMMNAGKIKVLAVTGRKRAPSAPDVPTVREAGFPALEMESIGGIFGPRDMPLACASRSPPMCGRRSRAIRDRHEARCDRSGDRPAGIRRVRRRHQGDARPTRRHRQGARHEAGAVAPAVPQAGGEQANSSNKSIQGMENIMRSGVILAAALTVCVAAGHASAQTYPQRAVKFLLPFGPGSGADITTRLVGDKLATRWGKPVVVENKAGGDGMVAINTFLSANDDHTLLYFPVGTFATHPFTHAKVTYDANRDLIPVVNVTATILAIGIPSSMKPTTLREMIELLRAEPDKHNSAAAAGNSDFLLSGLLKTESLKVAKAPYRDIMQAPADVGEGRVHSCCRHSPACIRWRRPEKSGCWP